MRLVEDPQAGLAKRIVVQYHDDAIQEMFEKIDRRRRQHGISDLQIKTAIQKHLDSELADLWNDWCEEDEDASEEG